MFICKNNYPNWVIKQILTQVEKQQKRNNMNNNNNDDSNTNNENEGNSQMSEKKLSFITLPYKEQQGGKVLKSFRRTLLVYTGTKLSSNFQLKDKKKFGHKHDSVYYVKCPECQEDYIGEIGTRLHERICDHSGKNSKSYMLKLSLENDHKNVSFEDFRILWIGYNNSKVKRKISEALFIKELRPSLNTQETSLPLLLYNE